MITLEDAAKADEFHIGHSGQACTVWRRDGQTHYGPAAGKFRVFTFTQDAAGSRVYAAITTVNAGDFHTAADCPHARFGQSPVSDRPENQPVLSLAEYDADGYDPDGFNIWGYDRNGRDRDGYNRAGYDADGFNRAGYDADGFNADGFNVWGYDADGYDKHGINADGYDSAGRYWTTCDSCEERHPFEELTGTLGGSDICESCRENNYSYCDDCEGWYHDDNSDDHGHGYDGCCESPQQEFAIRNDGCEPLANDTRITVTLPAGNISAEGLSAIRAYLRQEGLWDLAADLDVLGCQWQARDGNFPKRLSRHAYKAHRVKLTPEILSQVGCIARDHSSQASASIEVTRDLNQSAGDFYYEGSCWWGSYSESRCALKTNGGFGLRSFDSAGDVTGRAWVMPLRTDESARGGLRPTFDTRTPDAFVVFNGYGDLGGYTAPRILAHMAGWTYRKIGFECPPMYVNAGGYLIAPEDIAEPYTDGSLSLGVRQHASLFEKELASV